MKLHFHRESILKIKIASTVLMVAVLSACETMVELPANVTTVSMNAGMGQGNFIDKADFSFDATREPAFSELKLCVAENVQNQAVQLRDSAGSFVGRATGTYYQTNNVQTQSGGAVFKYVDDGLATLVATGTTMAAPSSMGLVQDVVRFDLRASVKGKNVALLFQNITRAQQNTGTSANDGFSPVGAWSGARAPGVIAALEAVAGKLRQCVQ